MTDINIQMVFDSLMYGMPGYLFIIFTTFMIFISMHIGKWHSHRMWKHNIKLYLPKIAREEIKSRDKKIERLAVELGKSKKENNRLNAHCTAMKNIADVMKPIESDKPQPPPVRIIKENGKVVKKGASK